jgi:dihydroorotate dehydrogenase (fumarate)
MDLSTQYLGMKLRTPLVPSASPLSRNIDDVKRLEDAGAAAVVFHSVFEEQLQPAAEGGDFRVDPERYLDHISEAKESVSIPIIGSLNAAVPGVWVGYARRIEQAGANALELNIYMIPTDMNRSGSEVEQIYIDILRAVKSEVTIPVAVKLSPFFSNMANMARRLDDAGADALVLFNRFYQPDIDLGKLDVALTPNPQRAERDVTSITVGGHPPRPNSCKPRRERRHSSGDQRNQNAARRRGRDDALLGAAAPWH